MINMCPQGQRLWEVTRALTVHVTYCYKTAASYLQRLRRHIEELEERVGGLAFSHIEVLYSLNVY